MARGENGPDSDVDILVDLDPEMVDDLLADSQVQQALQDIIGRPVDIVMRGDNRPELVAAVVRDGIHAC
ncbi:nucleotidyltransferase family protein [Bradyrhizobium sp. USDA 4353]